MIPGRSRRLAVASLAILVVGSMVSASAAANTVPQTNADQGVFERTIAQLTPPQCAGMNLNRLQIGGSGSGGGNALILGTSGNDNLSGGGGNDCIIAGAGSDILNGRGGNDVLVSGPGFIDFLDGGGGNDVCYGMGFLNIPSNCETYIP